MRAKDILCSECGFSGRILGSDYLNDYGPWTVQCTGCGKETVPWAYQREAWAQWKTDNKAVKTTGAK